MSTHLLNRSCYTLLNSTIQIDELILKAKKLGYSSVALTDHNVMFAAAAFQHACEKQGIKPIHGMEVDCLYHDRIVPFLLLAKDNKGILNLYKLSSILNSDRNYCIYDELVRYSDHCFLIVYGEGGLADSELISEDKMKVMEIFTMMKNELPPFDVAISLNDCSMWTLKNKVLKEVCRSLKISTVALNKNYYLNEEDAKAFQLLRGIKEGRTLSDGSLTLLTGRHFLSKDEMNQLFDEEDLLRSDQIASECNADLRLPKTTLPKFNVPSILTSAQYLTQLSLAGIKKRFYPNQVPQEYLKRLQYELDVIIRMHYEDYFLIVYDFIRHARKNHIYVGPGRGSAAGSLVSYSLGITQIDPIQYHLLFERFLNPDRVSMPDIDTDIPDIHRQDVIDYVYQTYGENHICNIVTFNTLGARQVIRDTAKVMEIRPYEVDMITRLIPKAPGITLRQALQQSKRLKEIVLAEDKFKKLFETAMKIEGLPRHVSTHAAGIIMSRESLDDIIPTLQIGDGIRTSQFSMEYLEERGLIKMDFLGLRNLTIIDEIVKSIQCEDPNFQIMNIPLDDSETFRVFQNADTVGIFQFESSGMKNLLMKMKPNHFNDVAASLALYRPGPMENIPVYLENRLHPSTIEYLHPALKPILEETYGVMIYQEQIMLVAEVAAGFSLAKADILRKAMAKKNASQIQSMRTDFIQGAIKRGYSKELSDLLFSQIEKFAGYGFNKSHAVAYGLVAYQMAYLKAHYPKYFYQALLNSVIGSDVKTAQYIDECRRRKLEVLYPNVNTSLNQYTIEGSKLRLPFSQIKGLGYRVGNMIIQERENGKFIDFFDFVARMMLHKLNRSQFESLIDAGALDCFQLTRTTLRYVLDEAIQYGGLVQVVDGPQVTLNFDIVTKPLITRQKDVKETVIEREKDALGLFLGPHPIIDMRDKYHLQYPKLIYLKQRNSRVDGFAFVKNIKQHRTKKGKMMAFATLEDETATMEMAIMPWIYEGMQDYLVKGVYIVFEAKMNDDGSCLANKVRILKRE